MVDKKELLSSVITKAIREVALSKKIALPEGFSVLIERPKRESQGDWATNTAMKLTKLFGTPPMELAREIASLVDKGVDIDAVEVAPPGFINFKMTSNWIEEVITNVITMGGDYGRNEFGARQRVQVEFVSANPTGPIHLGHGRGAAVGDIMSSILEFSGWDVEREYYINDAGLQMDNLGKSTQSRYFARLGMDETAPFPEDGYPGDYIDGIAGKILEEHGDSLSSKPLEETLPLFRDETSKSILEMIRRDLSDFGVRFDTWFSEKSLYDDDLVPRTISRLEGRGYAYEKDGAMWFRSMAFGDDKDRVMIKNNGIPTYFTSDVAYLQNKYERGFGLLIYIFGADHHGYVPRLRSINKALGESDENLEFLLIQFVSLLRNGVPVSMSKRAGTFVTLREVMDEVGRDATRFSFVNRKCDSNLEFDLEVAKQTSSDNPVYYVQYAHARICSILREAAARGAVIPPVADANLSLLAESSEAKIAMEISRFPEEILKAAKNLEPHRIAFFATDIAEAFHTFYNSVKVLGARDEVMKARLLLVEAARITIANTLRILGIDAPEKM